MPSSRSGSPISHGSLASPERRHSPGPPRPAAGKGPARPPAVTPPLPRWRAWVLAARIPTLSAAVVPVLVGTALAAREGRFSPGVLAAALAASLLIQIGTNLANDLFDFKKGADTQGRLGPTRVTQAGLLSEQEVAVGTLVVFGLAVLVGAYLAWVGGWPIVVIGLAAIAAGVLYTAGPWPLGYLGLGDLFVFIFFGVAAVAGTYYLHAAAVTGAALAASVPVGLLVTNILVVNNLRDVETDRAAGKRTLAVRLGSTATRAQYTLFAAAAYAMPAALRAMGAAGAGWWLPYVSLPLAVRLVRRVWSADGPALNAVLKGTSALHLLYGLLLGAALSW